MISNDLIDIVLDNPSGVPLQTSLRTLAEMVSSLEDLCGAASRMIDDAPIEPIIRLCDAQRGSIRLRFNLSFETRADANSVSAPSRKDMQTRASEVLGIMGFFFALLGADQAHAPEMSAGQRDREDYASARSMERSAAVEQAVGRLQRSGSATRAEYVAIEIRGRRLVLIDERGLDFQDRVADELNFAADGEGTRWRTGRLDFLDPRSLAVRHDGQEYAAQRGVLTPDDEVREVHQPRTYSVLVLWPRAKLKGTDEAATVRFFALDPRKVTILRGERSQFSQLNGVIIAENL